VFGAAGFTGALTARLLHRHPAFELRAVTSRSDVGRRLDHLYPQHRVPIELEELDLDAHANVDAAVVAYPHGAAAEIVAELLERGVRVVDLSADFRLRDQAGYELWYREQAGVEVTGAVVREARRLGVTYTRVTIRDQLTRWGSCSKAGALSFNWRLIIAPPAILTYVVVHELSHRIRHDHSPEFWEVVAGARPTYVEERAWLAEHGPELLAYRVPKRRAA